MLDSTSMSAVQVFISGYVMKTVLSTFAAAVVYVVLFPVRTLIKSVKDRWEAQTTALIVIQTELTTQRTNCFTTLQDQGRDQIKLLEDISHSMQEMRISQGEISGYLRGIS